nr:DUF1573 domain-containing protein [uncultured Flavobacterium sp.]
MKKIIGLYALVALTTISCKESAADKFDENAAPTELTTTETTPAVAPENMPVVTFDTEEVDLGTLKIGDKGEGTVKITNTGKTDLVIFSAQGSCGCTVPETPKAPIAPGQSFDMKVTFDSAGKPGLQQKTVTLSTNTAIGSERFTVKADVKTE